jgi:hypothetical protein
MDSLQSHTGQLLDLTADECWTLAASKPAGRIAWAGPTGPTVIPVNFVLTPRRVHVRTAAYSALARECDDSLVAFEVDEFDAHTRSGWSVLLRGRAHLQFGGTDGRHDPDVWPAGAHGLRLTIDVQEISGRRVV